jgi:amino acid adenylation domain-containing protein
MNCPILLHDALREGANQNPDKTALVCGRLRLSYRELLDRAGSLASEMRIRGLERGDRVVILLPNCPASVIAIYGTLMAQGTFSVLNASMKAPKLDAVLTNAEPAFVITDAAGLRTLSAIPDRLPRIGVLVTGDAPLDAISFDAACLRGHRPGELAQVDLDLAAIIYTSGTTSTPKGVALSHRNMTAASRSILEYLQLDANDTVLSVLPLSFDYGLYQLLLTIQAGGTLVLRDGFGFPFEIAQAIAAMRVTVLPCVPTMMAVLLRLRKTDSLDLSSVRKITNTGAALPAAFVPRLQEIFPNSRMYSMYGLTECKRVSWLPPEEIGKRPDSVGRPMPNTEVYVVDKDGRWHARDAVGELVVRGSNVMCGYYRDPEATDRALRPGLHPWERALFTGDLFRIDTEGYLYFLGRKDQIFKSRGERVSPREIEVVLYAIPGVTAARVTPVPDEVLGNSIRAELVCDDPDVSVTSIMAHCRQHLETRLVPDHIEIVDRLPVSASGKVCAKEPEA